MKAARFLLLFLLLGLRANSQPLTPDRFLGYKLGSKFTYHHRITGYFQALAEQYPAQIRLVPYGTTYEDRPLFVAVLASDDHLRRIDQIRTDHLKSIGLMAGTPSGPVPAIAWLSYNVHGNEAVSSEAAMKVAFEILNPDNPVTREVLRNTIVVIDPCVNPDGRERYTQWYNRVAAIDPDPSAFAREHTEPWPGGRYNHYLADLNRDWAWQQQKESRERVRLYNQWMPHLHADFHEMGPESSYYFPPAAEPYHKDITRWQRDFNKTLGEFNRKYFDENGWLYYTRYDFDLFYPSYGDTWPTYNGAIGMTYEQAGGGRAGLALVRRNEGDTLTLEQRIRHHYATSLATLETISAHAAQTTQEFVRYFEDARNNPVGIYKTYLVKTGGSEGQAAALRGLLDNQGIRYGLAGRKFTTKGTDLANASDQTVRVEENDLLISSYQPKSTLLKILFEPEPELEDSLTYDITTWGLTYALGLRAFGLKEKLIPAPFQPKNIQNTVPDHTPYAYLANWSSFEDVRFLARLLRQKVKVRSALRPFELDGKKYQAGTLIITRRGNEAWGADFDRIVTAAANEMQVTVNPVFTGFVSSGSDFGSGQVQPVKPPKILLAGGEGVSPLAMGEVWHFFEQQLGYPVTIAEARTLGNDIPWNEIDVLILPSGNYAQILHDKLLTSLREWVGNGGRLIVMENALNAFADKPEFDLKRKKTAADKAARDPLKTFASTERDHIRNEPLGSVYRVSLDTSHPLAFGYADSYYALIRKSWNFEFLPNGWNVGYLKENARLAGFTGSAAAQELKHTPVIACQDIGRGSIVYMTANPLFRGFWYGGKLLFGNALFR